MNLFTEPQLDGLWLIKWIDRFHLGSDAESPKVDVLLQKLPFQTLKELRRLSAVEITEILGKRVGIDSSVPEIRCVPVLAGYLPKMSVGAVVQNGNVVACLPGETRSVFLTKETPWNAEAKLSSDHEPPDGWSSGIKYKVLNKFEFQLGGVENFLESRCVVFSYNDAEYILPKMAIFRAYYGWSSKLVDAICSSFWPDAITNLVSFSDYESGIKTGVDEESGVWRIVLQVGLSRYMGPLLALLWFDDFGRSKASAIYSDGLKQNEGRRGGAGNKWFVNADIPHRFEPRPFEMDLQVLRLRPLRPSMADEEKPRYLVTSIVGSSWSLPEQKIEVELHLSGAKGDEQRDIDSDRDGHRPRQPVDGDPDAIGVSTSDPYSGDSVNIFYAHPFEYINTPQWKPQRKASSVRLPPAATPISTGPSSLLSAGIPTHGDVSPSPAEIQSKVRARSQQFEFLVRALDEIRENEVIDSCSVLSPFAEVGLTVMRNGMPCWSLLTRKDRLAGKVPREGWEVVFDEWIWSGEVKTRERHARCVLIFHLKKGAKEILLMEIEPRLAGPTFPMFAVALNDESSVADIIPVLKAIRENGGVFDSAEELSAAFSSMNPIKIDTSKHSYNKKFDSNGKVVEYTGLRADILAKWIAEVLESLPG